MLRPVTFAILSWIVDASSQSPAVRNESRMKEKYAPAAGGEIIAVQYLAGWS